MNHFGIPTFNNTEVGDPSVSINTFAPTAYNMDQWVSTAVAMKAKYAVFVYKHHEGMIMAPSLVTARNIGATTWYANNGSPNIAGQYITKMRAASITPYLYFSIWDKNFELLNPGFTQVQYRSYLEAQITEFMTNYGPLPGIWLDGGYWHFLVAGNPGYPWPDLATRNAFLRAFNPSLMIVDNSHYTGVPALTGDILTYEGGTVGQFPPTTNGNAAEFVETIRGDNKWFWGSSDGTPKTSAVVLTDISQANARSSAVLMNFPPDTTGTIPAAYVTIANQIGAGLP